MLYREAGQFKTTYASDQAIFPILQDRIGLGLIIVAAYLIPLTHNDFLINAVMIPFLIFALASIGLNILTGYTGLLSLGTGVTWSMSRSLDLNADVAWERTQQQGVESPEVLRAGIGLTLKR